MIAKIAKLERPRVADRVSRLILTGVLAAGMASPITLMAQDEAYAASITVNQVANEDAVYEFYQVFTADVTDEDVAAHIAWNEDVKDDVLTFLEENGYGAWLTANNVGDADVAQNAAEYIAKMIDESTDDAGASTNPTTKVAGSFANELAAVVRSACDPAGTAGDGESFEGSEGYYLVVTDATTATDADGAATAPLWITLGGSLTEINAKEALPTVSKAVKGVGDDGWSKATDAFAGQAVDYKVTVTMPSNIGAFETYPLKVVDTMNNMELVGGASGWASSASVQIVVATGQDSVTLTPADAGVFSYSGNTLMANIANLKSCGLDIDKTTTVTMTYKARSLGASAGSDGSAGNVAQIEYPADPTDPTKKSQTEERSDTTSAYSYIINVEKRDKSNGKALDGAKFTVQLAAYSADSSLVGKYVQPDGSLGNDEYVFVTDGGAFSVGGVDAATYTVKEVEPPTGYELQDADITLVVDSDVNGQTGALDGLEGTLSGGEAPDYADGPATEVKASSKETRTISVLAVDDKLVEMPLTGLNETQAIWMIAGGLATVGGTGVVLFGARRRNQEEE